MNKLLLTLTGVSAMVTALMAQAPVDLEVCEGKGYTLTSTADAVGEAPITYAWYENGVPIDAATGATYSVAAGQALGTYAYVRVAANAACTLSSNTYTVRVKPKPTIAYVGTSGSPTQTVNLGTAISAISYTATASATFTKIGSTFPSGLNVSNSGSSYTIYGQPSATGTFGYSLTASANGCTSAAAVGTITVNAASVIDPPYAASAQTWSFGGLTWSDVIQVPECDKTTMIVSVTTPDCRSHTEGGRTFYYYNWRYVYEHKLDMCAEPWRVPGYYEGPLAIGDAPSSIVPEWALGGQAYGTTISNVGVLGAYWPIGICCQNENLAYGLWISGVRLTDYLNSADGLQVRCVKD